MRAALFLFLLATDYSPLVVSLQLLPHQPEGGQAQGSLRF
jgi:hypothetical protein